MIYRQLEASVFIVRSVATHVIIGELVSIAEELKRVIGNGESGFCFKMSIRVLSQLSETLNE
jgi:hypothetical protein